MHHKLYYNKTYDELNTSRDENRKRKYIWLPYQQRNKKASNDQVKYNHIIYFSMKIILVSLLLTLLFAATEASTSTGETITVECIAQFTECTENCMH